MKTGMNLLLWTDHLHDGLLPVLEQLKKIGYDGVEVPIFNPDENLHREWGKHLDNLGLRRTAVTIRTEGDNPISSDAKVRAAGIDATKRTLDCCRAIGAGAGSDAPIRIAITTSAAATAPDAITAPRRASRKRRRRANPARAS